VLSIADAPLLSTLRFDNRFVSELPADPESENFTRQVTGAFWSEVMPTPVRAPQLLAYSREMAAELGLEEATLRSPELVKALAGNSLLPGMQPFATCYGGHQFGHWAGQLGDGRAISLGEAVTASGARWELQLKGAGPTPYSRRADGRAVLRSSIREFLCSEAMHHLGVPTTRALSLVLTGDRVVRDMFYDGNPQAEPGAIVCRVAPSFVRFGHFEIFASRGEIDLLRQLVDFVMDRDFPDFQSDPQHRVTDWFTEICERTARLMVHWMRVGFVHGVMNTDNMSILGLTIDYGPYGWVDNFDPGWTPNTTDAAGRRYCFGRQPDIARWNLQRLGDALRALPVDSDRINGGLERFDEIYQTESLNMFAGKFGLVQWTDQDSELAGGAFELMTQAEMDMTEFFRQLVHVNHVHPSPDILKSAAYRQDLWQEFRPAFASWMERYAARCRQDGLPMTERATRMNALNPRFVLRNYLAQQAIDLCEQGDASMIDDLLETLRHPYDEQPGREAHQAKRPDWARQKAGCSMLSCSS
jgi:uncharacterized protein YdiU (UPF0061 family)